ncbi:peptidase U32 family protein [Filimonas effusa]|uniref:U32 family peptidase n=1 Tax=Filimonas effusa TaxID=2508721 RepID=A0A4Q1DCI1_9BACT|nr:peptidase U32 family protein [Filimonas effusa]RXK87152.1 U32 family peptidase [Filimonas effusa]
MDVELLSPAGSFDAMQAAINAGANAIYFGVEQLNMRSRSSGGFSIDDIAEVSRRCHAAGVKCYITLNTVMYEYDMQLLQGVLKEVKEHNVDAVIASDFAVIELCTRMGIPLHISTQANVSNLESVQFYARFADTIVLARELTLKQIANVCNGIKRKNITGPSGELVKIEIFIHGALCMAVSGKCYLSLHSQNASANRGACVQNCRRPYKVTDTETGDELVVDNEYIMSPQDLCTINILDEVIQSGAAVLKIEGRSKGAEYVHTVTACYREAINAIQEGTYNTSKVEAWMQTLATVYNRGFWEGYYLGREMGQWTKTPGSIATEKKIYAGKGSRFYPKIQVGEFIIENGSLQEGDTLLLSGNAFGMEKITFDAVLVNGEKHPKAVKGDKITFPFAHKITASDKLYKLLPAADA